MHSSRLKFDSFTAQHGRSQVFFHKQENMLQNDYETAYYYVQDTVTNKQK